MAPLGATSSKVLPLPPPPPPLPMRPKETITINLDRLVSEDGSEASPRENLTKNTSEVQLNQSLSNAETF